MKKLILSLTICLSMALTYAQEEQATQPFAPKNEFGAHAGFSTGVGLSYRHWSSNNKLGIQLTFLPVKTTENTFISTGISGLLTVYQTDKLRVFGYLGNHLLYQKESYTDYYTNITTVTINKQWNLGVGPGFSFGKTVGVNLMFGYAIYDVTGSLNLLPTGEIGLYYRFR